MNDSSNINLTLIQPAEEYIPEEWEIRRARILLLLPRMIFLIVVFIIGTVGNVLVLYVYHFKWRSSTFTFFVRVLAVLDLINCFTSMPAAIALIIGQDQIDIDMICSVTPFISLYTAICSGFLFIIIAVQRYQAISQPLPPESDLPRAKKLCFLSILLALVPSVLRLFLDYGRRSQVDFNYIEFNITMCVATNKMQGETLYIVYSVVLAILFFGIFGSLTVFYILMLRIMLKSVQTRAELFQNQPKSAQHNSNKHNSFKIFFAITVVFVLSYLPHLVVITFKELDQKLTPVRRGFYDLAYYSPLWNNAANPLVYSFFSKEFRDKCKDVFCCAANVPEKKFSVSFMRGESSLNREKSSC